MVFLLHQALERAATSIPQQEALRFHSQSLSYAALAARSNSLAHFLLELGVKRGDRVGIYMNKGLDCAIALYGIMKAGAAYVPLDPSAPASRLGTVIRDCGIRYLISSDDKKSRLEELLAQPITLKSLIGLNEQVSQIVPSFSWHDVYQMPSQKMPDVGTVEHDLAYILYTSGSTGKPKGIMHTHRSGLSFAQWAKQTYGLTQHDRLSNHAPLHFDLSTFDFFASALAGATTVIIPEVYKKLPASLSTLMADEKISVWYSVPFALTQLLLRGVLERRDLSALRWILFAGEPFPTKHLRQLMKLLPETRFSNLYGPTETNVCTYYHVPPFTDKSDEPIPIGRATANASALVVNATDEPLAAKQVGELLIGGPLVMRGYWGRPDLDQEAFLQVQQENDEGLFYRTGDLVELQLDGNLKFIGRKDRQIKRRGYRIELDEIEVALLSHAEVQEAAVFPLSDSYGSNEIQAVVTLKAGALLELADLARYLTNQLPWYAIPNNITIAKELPRTSTGKINRRQLQKEASQAKNSQTEKATAQANGNDNTPLNPLLRGDLGVCRPLSSVFFRLGPNINRIHKS